MSLALALSDNRAHFVSEAEIVATFFGLYSTSLGLWHVVFYNYTTAFFALEKGAVSLANHLYLVIVNRDYGNEVGRVVTRSPLERQV